MSRREQDTIRSHGYHIFLKKPACAFVFAILVTNYIVGLGPASAGQKQQEVSMSGANDIFEAVTTIGMTILAMGLAALGTIFLGVGFRLFFVDKDEVRKNASRSQSIRAFFKGQLSSRAEPPMEDMRTKQGMRYDKKKKAVIPTRTLSQEAIWRGLRWR